MESPKSPKEVMEEDRPLGMSHQEAMKFVADGISEIIRTDPLLRDLPPDVTLDELNSLIALEHGRAMTVVVNRADGDSYSVVVEQKATVMDLKKAIKRHVTLRQVSCIDFLHSCLVLTPHGYNCWTK